MDTLQATTSHKTKFIDTASRIWRQFNVVSDKDLIKRIAEHPTLEGFALEVLGIDEDDLKHIRSRKKDKREYIRQIIESSRPSFGRFMTQAYDYIQRLRDSPHDGGNSALLTTYSHSEILKLFRGKIHKFKGLSTEEALELCYLLYRLERTKAN